MSQVAVQDSLAQKKRKSHRINTPIDGLITRASVRIGGSKSKEVERFFKFAMVGLLGFVLDFGTVFILQSTIMPPVDANGNELTINVAIATTIAFIIAVGSNFAWNRVWTYPDSRSASLRKQLTQFALVSVSGWLARTVWIASSYIFLGAVADAFIKSFITSYNPTINDERKMGTMVAQFIGVIVVMIWNFYANRYWTYNDVD